METDFAGALLLCMTPQKGAVIIQSVVLDTGGICEEHAAECMEVVRVDNEELAKDIVELLDHQPASRLITRYAECNTTPLYSNRPLSRALPAGPHHSAVLLGRNVPCV
eukprot:932596-Prorocentrum_minimum.AAC.1